MTFFQNSLIIGWFLVLLGVFCSCSSPRPVYIAGRVPIPLNKAAIIPPTVVPPSPQEIPDGDDIYEMNVRYYDKPSESAVRRQNDGKIIEVVLPTNETVLLLKSYPMYAFEAEVKKNGGNAHFPSPKDWSKMKKRLLADDQIYTIGNIVLGVVIIRNNQLFCIATQKQ